MARPGGEPAPVAGRVRTAARDAGRALLDLLFPPRCPGCGQLGVLFCDACRARIEPVPEPACRRCGRPGPTGLCAACRATPSSLNGILAAAVFSSPLREAIHRFKYEGAADLAGPLAAHLAAQWGPVGHRADLLVPVPLHRSREAQRGYNQAALLARALGDAVGLPVEERLVVRQRATRQQTGLDPEARRRNVAGAFACRGELTDRRVVLVDDVCTTGATLEACASALRAAGAVSVWGFTLARPRWEPAAPDMGH